MERLLSDICRIQYGFAFDSSKFSDNEGIPLIRIRDVVRGFSETYTTEECSVDYVINDGDMLIGMDGEFNIAHWRGGKAYLNQRVCKLIPTDEVDALYLYYFMPKALKAIEDKTPFVTVKHLSAKELNKIIVPLPTMDEQKKIAGCLEKVDELITLRKQQLAKLDELVKARFVELFVNTDDTVDWPQASIQDVSTDMRTGPFGSALHHDEFVDKGVFVLGIDNAVENKFSYNRMRYITEEKYQQLKRYTVYPGDVIITIMGTVGRSAVIPKDMPKAINTKHLACITPNSELINSTFLASAFQMHPTIRAQLQNQCKGAIMDGLNLTIIKGLRFALPPITLQKQFCAFVEQTDKSKLAIQQSLDKLETLKKSLMQKYFG